MLSSNNLDLAEKGLYNDLIIAMSDDGDLKLVDFRLAQYDNDIQEKVFSTLTGAGNTFLTLPADTSNKIKMNDRKAIIEAIWNKASTDVRNLWINADLCIKNNYGKVENYTIISYLENQQQQNEDNKEIYNDIIQKIQEHQQSVGAGSSASSKANATPAIPSLPTQPHGGGSMLTDDSLEPEQKMLHGSLRKAIIGKINDNDIEKILTDSNPENIQAVLSTYVLLEDDTYTTFLMFALEQEKVNIAEYIVKNAGGDVIKLLLTEESIMVYKNYSPRSHTALSYAREQSSRLGMGLVKMIEEKMRELGLEVPAHEGQSPVNLGATPAIPPLLRQNRTNSFSSSISFDSLDYEDQYQSFPTIPPLDEDEDQSVPKKPTFLDKLSEHRGKIAMALNLVAIISFTLGAVFSGSLPAVCTLGTIGIIAAVATIVIGIKIAYDEIRERAEEDGTNMWEATKNEAKDLLSYMLPSCVTQHNEEKKPTPTVTVG